MAAAAHAQAFRTVRNDPAAALPMIERVWEEFSDLEETRAGVEMMSVIARVYGGLADNKAALAWVDRYLPIAERLGDLRVIGRGLLGRGSQLSMTGRPREGIVLLRGAHQLALANDYRELELAGRVLLTFYEQWGEPAAGLALGREGLDIGRRLGSTAYGFQMVGNTSICALRVGEWDWVDAILDEWLEVESDEAFWVELHIDRALLQAHRGLDSAAEIDLAARRRATITDPQYESYELFARAVAGLLAGEYAEAIEHAERAVAITGYFTPLAYPVAARAALWAGDASTARRLLEAQTSATYWGPVLEADGTRIRAGIAALEGRANEALTGFLDAIRAYEQLALPFEVAAAAVDMAVLLPGAATESPAAAAVVATARETLTRLGAGPFLVRLDGAGGRDGRRNGRGEDRVVAAPAATPSG